MALAAKVKVMPPVHESYQTDMVLKTASNALASYILLKDFRDFEYFISNGQSNGVFSGRFPATAPLLPNPSPAIYHAV